MRSLTIPGAMKPGDARGVRMLIEKHPLRAH